MMQNRQTEEPEFREAEAIKTAIEDKIMTKEEDDVVPLVHAEEKEKAPVKNISYTYNAERVVGNGSFGVVFAATCAETGNIVAVKKVLQDKRYKNREVQIIKELYHPNIIGLKHAFFTQGEKPDEIYLNMVMDYVPETVHRISKHYNKMKQAMPLILVKLYCYQMLRALAYLHALGIAHRDLKP